MQLCYRVSYYSQSLGRFLTPDPIGIEDDVNLYRYVKNRPMLMVDPYGKNDLFPWEWMNANVPSRSKELGAQIGATVKTYTTVTAAVSLAPVVVPVATAASGGVIYAAVKTTPVVVSACKANPLACATVGKGMLEIADSISGALGGPTTGMPNSTPLGMIGTSVGFGMKLKETMDNMSKPPRQSCGTGNKQ